jgi:hypothetical protein
MVLHPLPPSHFPAKAGIHCSADSTPAADLVQMPAQWIPAFAGKTGRR